MLPGDLREAAELTGGRRILKRTLPFYSRFQFSFDVRILELPHHSYVLGVILCPWRLELLKSGYWIGSPACYKVGGPNGDGPDAFTNITAMYPRPEFAAEGKAICLDYQASAESKPDEPIAN
jgi:hypothetical protein